MTTNYVKTKDGKVWVVWSDNVDEETFNVYPHDKMFDPEWDITELVQYSEVTQRLAYYEYLVLYRFLD